MRRIGQLIGVKAEQIEAYERLHAAVWPEVLATLARCHIHNYTIFRHEELLFAYFEYTGDDFEADMASIAADPKTRAWWALTDPLQTPLEPRVPGQWWTTIKEVFHTD